MRHPHRWIRPGPWLLSLGCFTALALLFTGQVWADYAYAGHPLSWGRALLVAVIDWDLWAIAAPGVAWLADRVRFSRRRWLPAVAVHGPAGIIVGAATLALEAMVVSALLGPGSRPFSLLKVYLTVATYWAIVVAVHVARHYREARARELHAAQLETQLARAQVEALKMQLHPHFLFNTLNAVSGLMREDVEAADLMLTRLADLLRRTFETADEQEVALQRELEFIEGYLAIQRTRYGERLRIDLEVAAEARLALVPSLILQPLVENAIRHGVADEPGPGRLAIVARIERDRLVIRIRNDGRRPGPGVREGYGLRNTRSRLAALYGARADLSLAPAPGGGAMATLAIPLAHAAAPA